MRLAGVPGGFGAFEVHGLLKGDVELEDCRRVLLFLDEGINDYVTLSLFMLRDLVQTVFKISYQRAHIVFQHSAGVECVNARSSSLSYSADHNLAVSRKMQLLSDGSDAFFAPFIPVFLVSPSSPSVASCYDTHRSRLAFTSNVKPQKSSCASSSLGFH